MRIRIEMDIDPDEANAVALLVTALNNLAAALSADITANPLPSSNAINANPASAPAQHTHEDAPPPSSGHGAAAATHQTDPHQPRPSASHSAIAGASSPTPSAKPEEVKSSPPPPEPQPIRVARTSSPPNATPLPSENPPSVSSVSSTAVSPVHVELVPMLQPATRGEGELVQAQGTSTSPSQALQRDLESTPQRESENPTRRALGISLIEPTLEAVGLEELAVTQAVETLNRTIRSDADYPVFQDAMVSVLVGKKAFHKRHIRRQTNPSLPPGAFLVLSTLPELRPTFLARFKEAFLKMCLQEFRVERPASANRMDVYPHAEAFAAFVLLEFVPVAAALKTILALMQVPGNRCAAFTVLGKTVEMCLTLLNRGAAPGQLEQLEMIISNISDEQFKYDVEYVQDAFGWSQV
eukprot:Plantae.Rhodophyta-Rhodochaete_pulchella.ctg31063.p1 GENE.Plantae.Rhodophyta-Rhodochaete_pulchella.ctg31063~~Plantae.Rhodophyta-Rhodochaete_pulchella.ctg31063.p1  ORF type:complete len:411 (-),score=33.52 Plantae.Rhodophyta-Rhodochaete_pulchella.ctg31063:74-1306(-)